MIDFYGQAVERITICNILTVHLILSVVLEVRSQVLDMVFLFKVITGNVGSRQLLEQFSLRVPHRYP